MQPPATKPVTDRLQLKPGRTLAVLNAPPELDQAIGAPSRRAQPAHADIALLFVRNRAALDLHLRPTLAALKPNAIFWLAYPKLTSPLAADLNRNIIHALSPDFGLDTVSQIAIDDDWSAMRLKRL